MAQWPRESRRTPLSIELFWERATSDPPIRWEKLRIQMKLAILAGENITLDTLLQPKPSHVRLPAEPKYEMTIDDATEQTERDRQIRNSQLKLQWELKCQKITEAGVLCGERPLPLCNQKCVSLFYLSIGTKRRRLLAQKFPHENIYDYSTPKLWEVMKIAFIRPRNITFNRYVFFSRKQKKSETVEQLYSSLKELAENCDFENRVEVIFRDIFIANMLDDDIQREFLRDTEDPDRALSKTVNCEYEMGHQNQQRISSNNNKNNANGNAINAIQSFNSVKQSGLISFNRAANSQCRCSGQNWTSTHRQVWPALGKKCNHCSLLNHFAKVCRKEINITKNSRQDTRINKVEIYENRKVKMLILKTTINSIIMNTTLLTTIMLQW